MMSNENELEHLREKIQDLNRENGLLYEFEVDYTQLNNLVKLYENMQVFDKTLVLLYDHAKMRIVFASNNSVDIIGYSAEEIKAMGILLYFRLFHISHLGFPFRQLRIEKKLHSLKKDRSILHRRAYVGGLKCKHKNGEIRRGFFRIKHLIVNKNNLPELSLLVGEDFSHFFKGESYWFRVVHDSYTYCYVSHYGKKEFKDLISPREIDILRLIAENKSTSEIAALLHISKNTIDTHRKNMIARTSTVNTTGLVHLCKMADII